MIELTNTRPKGDKNEELADKTSKEESVDTLPKGDEEIKEKTKIKILTPNKLLARLATLLAQMKYGYNSQKLENIFMQILHLLYQHKKSNTLQQFHKLIIAMRLHINGNKILVITKPKTIYFDLPQDVNNLNQ